MNTRDSIITELKNWLNQVYREEKKPDSSSAKLVKACTTLFGASVGAASAYIMYFLSAEFGENASNYLGIDKPAKIMAIKNLLGLSAAIPMAALAALNVTDSLSALTGYFTKPKLTSQTLFKKKSGKEQVARGLFAVSAPFSSIPQSTLTWNYTSNPGARIFFTACAVTGPTFFNGRGGQKLIDAVKQKYKAVLEIETYLEKCQLRLKNMSDNDYRIFLQRILNEEEELTDDFLNILFTMPEVDSSVPEKHLAKTIFSVSGGLLGLISAIIFFQLSVEGLQNPLQLNEPVSKYTISTLAYILNAALSSLATRDVFQSMYKILFRINRAGADFGWPKVRKLFMCIAVLIGPFAALPLGSLQITNAQNGSIWQKILIGPTFLGPSCVRSKAVYDLLNRLLDFCVDDLESNPKRNAFLNTLEKLHYSIKDFHHEVVSSLYETRNPDQSLRI